MPASPLAAAMLGANSSGLGLLDHPMAAPDLQLGQAMVQQGLPTAPASPLQALARVALTSLLALLV